MGRWHTVPAAVLEPGGRALVQADGHEIAVFSVEGVVHALGNQCPHAGNPLIDGEVLGPTLTCVYHGWKFDLETGACLAGDEPARRYRAEVRGDELWIELGD